MYLSGPPLHLLAIALVARFRRAFGARSPISFSGGVDRPISPTLSPSAYARDRLQRPVAAQRLPARMGLHQRPRQAHGRGRRDGHRHAHAQGAWPGRGRARHARIAGERSAACRAALAAGSDLRAAAGEAFAAWVSAARVLNAAVYAERASPTPITAPRRTRRRPTRSAARSCCSTASPATSASRSAPTTPTSSCPSRRAKRRSSG